MIEKYVPRSPSPPLPSPPHTTRPLTEYKLVEAMGGRGVGPGMMGRPPPPRLPPNLPALQGMGNPPSGGPADNSMGMGPRGSSNGMGGGGAKNGPNQGGSGVGGPDGGGGGGGPSINVYVGKLKPETDNALVQELLVCCGRVEKWNRAVDPSTDLPKAFGFCTYRNAQAAAISVQVRWALGVLKVVVGMEAVAVRVVCMLLVPGVEVGAAEGGRSVATNDVVGSV